MTLKESVTLDSSPSETVSQIAAFVLDKWKRDIDLHRPAEVASHFTTDALFQGSHPTHSVGRRAIEEYYAEQPVGLTVEYQINEVRALAPGIVCAYVDPTFTRPDGAVLRFHLTAILQRQLDGQWLLCHYHVGQIA
jgi:uncharacterized protein (TIGR02246 family)